MVFLFKQPDIDPVYEHFNVSSNCARAVALWPSMEMASEGPEYQDGRRQSSLETSKVLHEILREMKVILAGVKSLSLNSAVSRRSTSTGNGGADPANEDDDEDDDVDDGAKPNIVVGRADPNAVDADNFQKYCIEGIVAVLGSMLLGMVLCCVLHVWKKRRKRLAASKASSERPDSRTEASRIFAGV
ncbi:uncharacterized protein ACIQIH_019232 [Cyanocitta cristata]